MTKVPERKRELLERIKKHIQNEKLLIDVQSQGKVSLLSEQTILSQVYNNNRLGDEIRELIDVLKPIKIQDPSARDHLIKIRDEQTETDKLYNSSFILDLSTGKVRPKDEIIEKLEKAEEEKRKKLEETLDDMIHYLMDLIGVDSVTFYDRSKAFGTLIVGEDLPANIDRFLEQLKICYHLNMHEAVIGLSRILLEVACQSIYFDMPEEQKLKIIPKKKSKYISERIQAGCEYRLKALGNNQEAIDNFRSKTIQKWKKASDILHGKLSEPVTHANTLAFVKEVFHIIEALYDGDT